MKSKQIIINYDEYLEMEQKIKELINIIAKVRFSKNINDEKKYIDKNIDELNKFYGFWL